MRISSFIMMASLMWSVATAQAPVVYDMAYINDKGICVYSLQQRKEKQVLKGEYDAFISPDGTKVAYTRSGKKGERNIAIIDIATGKRTVLNTGNDNSYGPVWSPDGQWLAYNSFNGKDWSVCIIAANGSSTPRNITEVVHADLGFFSPTWSADSRKLLVQDMAHVYILGIDGTVINKIPIAKMGNENGISSTSTFILTADEQHIVFDLSVDEPGFEEPPGTIFVYDIGKGTSKRIAPKGIYCFQLFLSGNKIYFNGSKPRQRNAHVYSMELDGSNMRIEFKNCRDLTTRR